MHFFRGLLVRWRRMSLPMFVEKWDRLRHYLGGFRAGRGKGKRGRGSKKKLDFTTKKNKKKKKQKKKKTGRRQKRGEGLEPVQERSEKKPGSLRQWFPIGMSNIRGVCNLQRKSQPTARRDSIMGGASQISWSIVQSINAREEGSEPAKLNLIKNEVNMS